MLDPRKLIILSLAVLFSQRSFGAYDACEFPLIGPEWGKINAVVIGNPVGAHFPHETPQMLRATLPSGPTLQEILANPGRPFDPQLVKKASREIDQFIRQLESLGVQVLQPQISNDFFDSAVVQPHFRANSGLYAAMPRDNLLFLPPNLVVLAPMSWRSRYRESEAYQAVLKNLESMGLKVVMAPRPKLDDSTYVAGWQEYDDGPLRPVITNQEPLFDAADFLRFGNHIIGQLTHVTNRKGIEWIRSILDPKYHLHIIEFADPHAMHIDASLMPLDSGRVLVHPERVPPELREVLGDVLLKGWQMIEVPKPDMGPRDAPLYFTSRWINMNILVGDQWAFVEKKDKDMAKLLATQGIEPIPSPLQHFQALGGSFHCATLDLRCENRNASDNIEQSEDLHIYFDPGAARYKVESLQDFLFSKTP